MTLEDRKSKGRRNDRVEKPGPETSILLEFVKELKPKKTLEVGCNFGRELSLLKDLTRIYGVDKNPDRVKKAKKVLGVNRIKVGEAQNIPYQNNYFDLVYTDGCLSHNESVSEILDELLRVSKNYVLNIEYVGTKLGPTGFGNCKKNTWVHDYEKLWATKDVQVCFSRKVVFGTDMFHVILVKKLKTLRKIEKIIKPEKEVFCLKFWKLKFKLFKGE